jgi:hypothetical protein
MGNPVFHPHPGPLKAIPMVRAKHRIAHLFRLHEIRYNVVSYK